jgi:hypothetical protein
LVRVVYGSRYLLIALSLVLYFSAIIVHLLIAPTSIALLLVIGVLVLVLTNDPGTGVMRHVDAGYEEAIECVQERGLKIPML